MRGAPRSKEFDDVYFSKEDGLAETRHVFIAGNGLPGAWRGRERFTIAETGFGTGLNFLAAWKLFRETAEPGAVLDFVSFEKFPLAKEEIREALSPWGRGSGEGDSSQVLSTQIPPPPHPLPGGGRELGRYLDLMLEKYPPPVPGFHRMMVDAGVFLTLVFGDVNETMPQLEARVDFWFLDGFRPRVNPDMWNETVFGNMARLSAPGATFATFTAVGKVKRGLRAAGFEVTRVRGFGSKWHMLTGIYKP